MRKLYFSAGALCKYLFRQIADQELLGANRVYNPQSIYAYQIQSSGDGMDLANITVSQVSKYKSTESY